MSFSVCTYNVLAITLATQNNFPVVDPINLSPRNRILKIFQKLFPCIEKGSVICLQEVDFHFLGALHVFMKRNGYTVITSQYGKEKNGFMGVSVCFPNILTLEECSIFSLGPEIDVQTVDEKTASAKPNTCVFLRLRNKISYSLFCVGTYHMPCMYKTPEVMTILSETLYKSIIRRAGTTPFILAGDFNFGPSDSMYGIFDKGMTSAYKQVNGEEPVFTNYSHARGQNTLFFKCLDYIWMSPGCVASDILVLKGFKHMIIDGMRLKSLPSAEEPSDHLMLGASIALPKLK